MLCIVVAYLVLFLMKVLVFVIVWTIILLLIVGFGVLAAWLIYMALSIKQEN